MHDKLRIGIIGTRGIPNRYGGFEAFAGQISPRLAEKGHEVTVYCSHDQPYTEKTLHGVNLVHRYNPESWMGTAGQFVYDLNCNLHARHQPFDVILHLGYTSDSVWTWLWSNKSRHLTNMDGMEWMRSKYTPMVRVFLKKAEKWAASQSNLLIADSKGIREYIESRYATPVRYISYGADIPSSYNTAAMDEFNVDPYRYDLLIARMEPENNIEMAAEAKLLEDSTVPLLIFSNKTGYGKQLGKKYQHEKRIRFQEADYRQATLNSLRHYARYYIHGHSAGGTNPSLLEAMACGCRILAHDNPFNRGVLEENAGFYRATHQLTDLLNQRWSPDKFHQQAENNLASIKNNHNWEFITNEYESAFCQALGL
jgi:glycosyltransferase involved in cell wall biosynthesis